MPRPLWLLVALALAGPARAETLTVDAGGGTIEMNVERRGGRSRPSAADLRRWLGRAAAAVTGTYGRLPVADIRIDLTVGPGRAIDGTAYMGRFVRMSVGTEATLDDDWTLTHELFHLGFPSHDRRLAWMQEGMATYFEPLARARAGEIPAEEVWRWMCDGLPKGMPKGGERELGLNARPTWGATYWGGALFWLLVDLGIREETQGRRSADDVLRGLVADGGDGTQEWPVARILEVGDRVTGTRVMSRLYERMAVGAWTPDLDDLQRRLGVDKRGDRVLFHDDAPLAGLRRALTAR